MFKVKTKRRKDHQRDVVPPKPVCDCDVSKYPSCRAEPRDSDSIDFRVALDLMLKQNICIINFKVWWSRVRAVGKHFVLLKMLVGMLNFIFA